MSRKKFIAALTAVAFIFTLTSGISRAEVVGDGHWVAPINPAPTWRSANFQDDVVSIDTYPHLTAEEYKSETDWNRYVCTSTQDAHCQNKSQFSFTSILPVCDPTYVSNCIEGVESISSNGTRDKGVFQNYTIPDHINKFTADPKLGIPATETPSIWNLANTPNKAGIKYALVAGIKGSVRTGNSGNATGNQLYAYLIPASTINSTDPRSESPNHVSYDNEWEAIDSTGHYNSNGYGASVDACVISLAEQGKCITPVAFPEGYKFSVKIKLSQEPTAWLHGRMVDPSIQVSKIGSDTEVIVEAGPTNVPVFYFGGIASALPDEANKFWWNCFKTSGCAIAGGTRSGPQINWQQPWTQAYSETFNLWLNVQNYGEAALNGIKVLAPLAGDKSVAQSSSWSFHTLSNGEMQSANPCFATGPGLKGIVSTNSTVYSEGPPVFANDTLNYKVASAHYTSDGSVFKGSYNLVMRSDVARCVYKFSSAPIKASIEVVSENGDASNVATTAANEKDGWLYLSANNFTFSAPTVKVKLSQDVAARPSPVAPVTTTAPKPTSKQSAITCVKGKTTKKITAATPVCPKGYVKK